MSGLPDKKFAVPLYKSWYSFIHYELSRGNMLYVKQLCKSLDLSIFNLY